MSDVAARLAGALADRYRIERERAERVEGSALRASDTSLGDFTGSSRGVAENSRARGARRLLAHAEARGGAENGKLL